MSDYRTIGVAGSIRRIGTTTQALLLQNYLNKQGHRSIYVEMNDNHYLRDLVDSQLYADTEVESSGLIRCIDHLLCPKDIFGRLNKDKFKYIIKDYGSVQSKDFEKTSFLEQDVRVFVCGVKANEIGSITNILEDDAYQKSCFIFSYVAKEDQGEISHMMQNNRTYFADFVPDPFSTTTVLPYGQEIAFGRLI